MGYASVHEIMNVENCADGMKTVGQYEVGIRPLWTRSWAGENRYKDVVRGTETVWKRFQNVEDTVKNKKKMQPERFSPLLTASHRLSSPVNQTVRARWA